MTQPALDTMGMWDATASLPEQVQEAVEACEKTAGLPDHDAIENVVVLGMGGSGIAGDILLASAAPFMAVPVVVVKSYTVPAFVNENSLVFAVSFSGNTEETLESASEAMAAGGRLVVVGGEGELAAMAEEWGITRIGVSPSIPMPRAAVGALAVPPLLVLEQVGLFPGARDWIDLAVTQLKRRRDRLVADNSAAEQLARRLAGTFPLMHSSGALGTAAINRWKGQIHENAKSPAFGSIQPELCHNEIVGWGQHGDITRQLVSLVQLRHDHEHPQVSRRFELVAELIREVMANVEEVRAEGDGELAQLLDLILFGDFVSLHLAGIAGIDPGPVAVITELKALLTPSQ